MSKPNHKNETGYDLWSSFYDTYPNPTVAIDDLNFPKFYEAICNQEILEIGCGTGRHTSRLLALKNKVTGIDLSEGMLSRLREKIKDPNLNLIKGDFFAVSFAPSSFDAILTSLVLEHLPELNSFFNLAAQVLRPGGKIYLSEIHPDRTAQGSFAHFKNLDGTEVHFNSHAHSINEISKAAIHSGFEIEEVRTILGNAELVQMNSKWAKYLDLPMLQIWRMRLV